MTTKYFTANPHEQGEESAGLVRSWNMAVVFVSVLGNARCYQKTMKCSKKIACVEACLGMVVVVVADTRAERDDIQGGAVAMPVASEEDSLAPAVEVQGVEVDGSS